MEFPPSWEVLRAELMDSSTAPDNADVTVQLNAQLRNTGRILDGFQLVLGGTRILDAEVDLGSLIPASHFNKWKLKFQFWPRDIVIRRNMMTSSWIDVPALVCSNEASVHNSSGSEVLPATFMERLESASNYELDAASICWAVIAGEDDSLRLQLQGLPAAAVLLSGRHQFKG
jgi:hypothetical protein